MFTGGVCLGVSYGYTFINNVNNNIVDTAEFMFIKYSNYKDIYVRNHTVLISIQ